MSSMIILLGLLGSFEQVRALPFLGKPCVSSGYTRGMSSLIHNVAIMPNDQRFGIIEGGPKFGLSDDETKWLRSIVGEVRCSNIKNPKLKYRSTGIMIDRSDQVLTNAHMYFQKIDGKVDFGSCMFITKSEPPIKRKINLGVGQALFGTEDTSKDPFHDYAVAKLDKPIPGVKPLQRARDFKGLENREILVVSAQMDRMNRSVGPNEPIIQKCSGRKVVEPSDGDGTIIYSDCSGAGGGSGSINLVRGRDGQLVGVGIIKTTFGPDKDNQPYSYENDNFTVSIAFDERFQQDLDLFARSAESQ